MFTHQQYQTVLLPQQKSTIQKLLDNNSQLITLILDLQAKGKQIECLEYQRTLHGNLTYLAQFDPTKSHYTNNLPPPDSFIQTQSPLINGNITQSDQVYQVQTNTPTPLNTLNQTHHIANINLHSPSSSDPLISNSVNKPVISQQHLSQGRVANSDSIYPTQQNGYGQYSIHHHQQQNILVQSNQQNMYNERQQMYHPQQNHLMQQQWQNQSRISIQQQYASSSNQRQVPPQT